jgi:ABC-type uncharacterized transport system involved in gliding motility auxiliary subunit
LRLAGVSFAVLFLTVVGLALWLARDYRVQVDLSRGGRNSLSEASIALLNTLDQPVKITAYASERKELRKTIRDLVARYQRHKADIALEFVSPDADPARVRAAGVRLDGELIVEYRQARENIQHHSEDKLTNALTRLARGGERWLVFVSGHGERSPERQANHDLSLWAGELAKRGIKTRSLALGGQMQIPQNTAVLVIAGPRVKYLPGEVKKLEDYIKRGGNLLWLADPGPLHGLEPLAELLGVEFQRGVIVDPVSQALTGASATFYVATEYGAHPIVQNFTLTTLFPDAVALSQRAPKDWRAQELLRTGPSAWSETAALTDKIQFDKGQDIAGPLGFGITLTHKLEAGEQRVAVIGDGDFLSNTFLGNGGNLEFGMNLVNWAASDDGQVNLPARIAPDLRLDLSQPAQLLIALGFLVVLPLMLVASGAVIWWRRRRA